MNSRISIGVLTVSVVFFIIGLFLPGQAIAHCDGLDGPVVKAAQKALQTGNVNLVLVWIQTKDESEIRNAFQNTLAVRELNPQAKELADMYFFETLVRVHRAGEGAPYTGLQPPGRDLGPAIPAADRAVADGRVGPVVQLLTAAMQTGVRERFDHLLAKQKFDQDDVSAGKEYVTGYVEFVHYVERIYEAAKNPAEGHYLEPRAAMPHE